MISDKNVREGHLLPEFIYRSAQRAGSSGMGHRQDFHLELGS